jgi:HlyD family secretion protein
MQSQVVGQVGGVVARVSRKAGDLVQKGDTVIQLDDSQLQLSVRAAEAALEAARINLSTGQDTTQQASPKLAMQVQSAESALSVAQRNYDSRKALFDLGGATGADMDRAKSDLETARANLEAARTAKDQNSKADVQNIAQLKIAMQQADFALQQAQLNLQHATIRAPYAGRLVSVKVMPGEFVGQNVPAFVIGSQEREIDFAVPPADTASLPVGASLDFLLGGKTYPLKVSQSSEVPVNGVVPLVAGLPETSQLTFGAVGTISYSVTLARGAIVPTGSLQTNEDQNFVYVVETGKAVAHRIAILAESGATAAVTGVAAGSVVILNPPPGLLDGSAVKAVSQ